MNTWKLIRLSRIMNPKSGKTIIVPMDHHGINISPIDGIEDPAILTKKIVEWWADVILGHIGTITRGYAKTCLHKRAGSVLHMCATTGLSPDANRKMIVNTLKTAISLGVDAVSTQLNLWDTSENQMLQDIWLLANECMEWWMPLIAMVYVRWKDQNERDPELIRHSARIASELGCDIVKVPYTGDPISMRRVVEWTQIPVVIAGGSKMSDQETLEMIEWAMTAGCAGISIGRNIFQRENPGEFLGKVQQLVHEGKKVKDII